jgi:hypothetical protein
MNAPNWWRRYLMFYKVSSTADVHRIVLLVTSAAAAAAQRAMYVYVCTNPDSSFTMFMNAGLDLITNGDTKLLKVKIMFCTKAGAQSCNLMRPPKDVLIDLA